MSHKSLVLAKKHLAYKIRNIREDYSDVEKEDMPEEVTAELAALMLEMNNIQQQLHEDWKNLRLYHCHPHMLLIPIQLTLIPKKSSLYESYCF